MSGDVEYDDKNKNVSTQESQSIEWKWSWQDEFLKWLCGYANTDGGTIYIGVNDDGYVVGLKDSKGLLEVLPNKINDKLGVLASVKPYRATRGTNLRYGNNVPEGVAEKLVNQYAQGKIRREQIDQNDRRYKTFSALEKDNPIWISDDGMMDYIEISVPRYPFAISCDGKYYKRSGSTLHELNGFELQNFLLERAGKTWDAVPIPGVDVSDLRREALDAFREKAVKSNRMTDEEARVSDELLLRNLKLFDGDCLTRAAILLFHPDPERFVTGAYIKIGYFSPIGSFGDDKNTIEDLQYQDIVDGPLILQVDKAIDLIFSKYMRALVDYEGVQRTETYMLTKGVVREILLNAINHKNYSMGVPIQVSIFEDRLIVFNVGDWPKRVPTDERVYQKHESVPHNPKIADVSFRSGDVEAWGRGYLKIKAECEKMSAPFPTIDAQDGGVSIKAVGCEQYIRLLRYGQYGQVGVDGVWRTKTKQASDEGVLVHSAITTDMSIEEFSKLMRFLEEPRTRKELQAFLGYKSRDYFRRKILLPLIEAGKIDLTIPDKPQSSKQQYVRHKTE